MVSVIQTLSEKYVHALTAVINAYRAATAQDREDGIPLPAVRVQWDKLLDRMQITDLERARALNKELRLLLVEMGEHYVFLDGEGPQTRVFLSDEMLAEISEKQQT